MHNDIITQNIKLIDEKLIINEKTSNAFIEGKNRLCKEIKAFSCGFNNFAIYRARILYISSDGMMSFKKGDNKKRLYQKNKNKKGG